MMTTEWEALTVFESVSELFVAQQQVASWQKQIEWIVEIHECKEQCLSA